MENIQDPSMTRISKEEMKKELVEMIMRQTNYTADIAVKKLKYWNYNTLHVIKDYLNPNFHKKKEEKTKTLNQRVMGEIRSFCERGQKMHDLQKNMRKNLQKLQNPKS